MPDKRAKTTIDDLDNPPSSILPGNLKEDTLEQDYKNFCLDKQVRSHDASDPKTMKLAALAQLSEVNAHSSDSSKAEQNDEEISGESGKRRERR